jgi:hypothetical protein
LQGNEHNEEDGGMKERSMRETGVIQPAASPGTMTW